ncbi:ATP-binding domain-containing protein, partial [Chromobacterium amazonense]|uniref:ATP-binding domain-containing protein n=1 Tax=Chromobacterium amazonense TaxID=1382803 RepID=UPI003F7B1E93
TVTVDPATLPRLSVYQRQPLELSVGDLVRNNRNDAARDLTNGDKFRVEKIEAGQLQLASLERDSKTGEPLRTVVLSLDQPLHLEHGYASTIHGAQGLTYRQALVDLDTFSRTTSMNLYYVAISRAKERAEVFTNDVGRLPQAIARRFSKSTAQEAERVREVGQRISREVAEQPSQSVSPDTKEKLTAFVVDYAIAHLSEREHVFKRRDILEHALKRGVGDITQDDVAAELQRREAAGEVIAAAPRYLFLDEQRMRSMTAERWVQWFARRYDWSLDTAEAAFGKARETNRMVTAEPRVTTRQIWQQEQSLVALERAGRDAATPLVDQDALQRALALTPLNAGQREAVLTMLATPHRFVGIQGDAGTGKSFTVTSAVQLLDTTFDKLNRSSAPRPDAEGRVIMSGEEAFGRERWRLVVLAP